MGAGEARTYWDDVGLMMLLGSFLLAPLAWLLDLQISYSMVKWACENDRRGLLLAMPLGSLAIVAASSYMAWSCWTKLRGHANEEGDGVKDRSYFLAIVALGMNATFALLIVTSMAPRFFLSPCE